MTKRSWKKPVVAVMSLSLIAAACGDSDSSDDTGNDDGGTEETTGESMAEGEETEESMAEGEETEESMAEGEDKEDDGEMAEGDGAEVTVTGPERDDPSVAAINAVLGEFGEANGIKVTYTGDADWESNINTQVEGGNPPDIGIFPQPGKLKSFADAGTLVPLTDAVNATVDEYWADGYQLYGQGSDGQQYGVPVKTDLKSLVWYQPARFEAAGIEVPTTFDEFLAVVETIKTKGEGAPLCVGIESGQATGWPFTDWVEDMVLRQSGPEVYDQWINHEIPFNDPQIVEPMQAVVDLWNGEGNVFAVSGSISATAFGDNGQPLVDGDCWMHRQANFFAGLFPEGTVFADGSEEAVDVFYFPDINGDKPVLTAGTLAAAFDDDEATMKVLEYMGTAEYAEKRQAIQTEEVGGGLSGFLSAAKGQDPSVYQPLEQSFLEILGSSDISRFDGSDLMPPEVGAGTFWSEGTSLVNGDQTAQEAADKIEASWPTGAASASGGEEAEDDSTETSEAMEDEEGATETTEAAEDTTSTTAAA